MPAANNQTTGRQLGLAIRNDGDTAWELIGGLSESTVSYDSPVEDTTTSSSPGYVNESQHTGYTNVSISGTGMADNRSGATDPATGYVIADYTRLATIATGDDPCAKLQAINTTTGGTTEGYFNITAFSSANPQQGLQGFEVTFQSRDSVVMTGGGI